MSQSAAEYAPVSFLHLSEGMQDSFCLLNKQHISFSGNLSWELKEVNLQYTPLGSSG